MQSSTQSQDPALLPLGARRAKSDLARFSIDLSWPRGVLDFPPSRAYPSPPMSGSPPLSFRRNQDFDDHGQPYRAPGEEVARSLQGPPTDLRDNHRTRPVGPYPQESFGPAPYLPYHRGGEAPPTHLTYGQQQPQSRAAPQPFATMPIFPMHHTPPQTMFVASERSSMSEGSGYTSPKVQRKTKGHVASACVPCKRAHLRCDAQRPCSRCLGNGKQETCVDVQHKKRGRPRLRDEREQRFDGVSQTFLAEPEHVMRRPLSIYPSSDLPSEADSRHRTSPYRTLKSHNESIMDPRFIDRPRSASVNTYRTQMPPTPPIACIPEPPCAYLTMDLKVARASRAFCDWINSPLVGSRKLLDMVSSNDRDKIYRLQQLLDEERQEREPNYLPPIFGKAEEERVIQSVGLSAEDIARFRPERQEVITFQCPDGQPRKFPVCLGLAKKESTFFVVLVLLSPPAPGGALPQLSSPYTRKSQHRYQTPQQGFAPLPPVSPYAQYQPMQFSDHRNREQLLPYRQASFPLQMSQSGPVGSKPGPPTPSFPQHYERSEYSQSQSPAVLRNELPQDSARRPSELQLPPIRSQSGSSVPPAWRSDDRSGRVDICGMLQNPDSKRH